MKIIKTKVYTIDELSDKAKEKAREWYKEQDDMPFMADEMAEMLAVLLKKHKLECGEPKLYYSLSYCQGDGAMFEGVVHFKYKGKEYTAHVKQYGHYYHENSKTIDVDSNEGEDDENLADAEEYFNGVYVSICRELEKAGYSYIDDARSDECVDDILMANEYTFTSEGKYFS